MQELDDITLLREYAERDSEAAFAALVTRHVNKVYSVALRLTRNPHQAEEITQAVFVILAQKSRKLGKKVILSGWLYQTARLTAVTFIRSEVRRTRREQEAHMQSLLDETESDVWPQIAPLLDAAMTGLSETDRHAVVLRFFDDKSMREIGAALGASEDAAKMRVNRAVEKLQSFFSRHGVTSTTGVLTAAISANSVQAAPAALAQTATAIATAKGATASISTSTLIKGALKVMAWTKAKTAVVAGVVVLLAAGTATVTVQEIKSSRANAIFERIWAQPDTRSMAALIHAPPAMIVRPTRYSASQGQGYWTDARIGRGVWVNVSVSDLVGFAYRSAPWRTVFPDNMPGGGFDLMETLPAGQNEAELKKGIQKRFGLMGHTEMREAEVLQLEVNDPARLNAHTSAGGQPNAYGAGASNNTMNYAFKNQTLKDIASRLESYFDQPVVEPNNLNEHYDLTFHVDYKIHGEALKQSFRDQLAQFGLQLVPGTTPVEMLVVEKAP